MCANKKTLTVGEEVGKKMDAFSYNYKVFTVNESLSWTKGVSVKKIKRMNVFLLFVLWSLLKESYALTNPLTISSAMIFSMYKYLKLLFLHSLCFFNYIYFLALPWLLLLYSHIINMHIYTYTWRIHIDAIIKTSEDFFKKIHLSLYWKVCVWERELETEQKTVTYWPP